MDGPSPPKFSLRSARFPQKQSRFDMISEMMGAIMVYTTMLGDTRLWATGRWGHNVFIYIFSKVTRWNKMGESISMTLVHYVCVCMFSCVVCSCHVSIFFHPILDLVEISLIVSQHWIWNRRKLYRLYSSYLQQKGYPLIRLWVLTVAHMIWETRFLL